MRAKLFALLLLAAFQTLAGELKDLEFQGVKFRICKAEPSEIKLLWKDPATGKPFRSLAKAQGHLQGQGRKIKAIMNAGIYELDGTPTGLHVEDGAVLNPLNEKGGEGNFYSKPNGVFFIGKDGKAAILETGAYAKTSPEPKLALQSGPLLLLNGELNPKLSPKSIYRKHRNGIGVDAQGKVILAITGPSGNGKREQASLFCLASLFLELGCKDALYLDGEVSAMFAEPEAPIVHKGEFGAIISVVESAQEPEPPSAVKREAATSQPGPGA